MNNQSILQQIWEWVLTNKTWVFSGVGVAVVGSVFSFIFVRKKVAQKQSNNKTRIVIRDNNESPISFNGANFGIITNEVQDGRHKKED
jgi:hypothetical protein